jgi:DNA repair protein RadC
MRPESAQLVRDLPTDERPRERLLRNGSSGLSDTELVAILLRTGRPGISVLDLAREVLRGSGGLGGLLGSSLQELRRIGVGPAKAAALLASVELARRIARAELPERDLLTHPEAVATFLALRYGLQGQEVMGALFLDTRNRLIQDTEIFRGTLNRAAVEPRAILKQGLLRNAAGFVLFHTHPSGDPSPSAEDLAFTRRMASAGEVVGLRLVDHLIVGGGGRWVSLKKRGGW